jgi:peptide deformylase
MPPRPILELGHPDLWRASRPVGPGGPSPGLIQDLSDTLAHFRGSNGFGRGIAAPQIGSLERVIFLRVPGGFTGPLIDPAIAWSSPDRIELWDDCFSLPGLMVRVSRAAQVKVTYTDEHGQPCQIDASAADLAELLQHEIDHLDGILAIQRAVSPQALCTRAEWERRHR